jgi:threonine aldolase
LLGSKAHIKKALRIRKLLGGAMRQAGYMAAAGIYALDHHVERLADDHKHAKVIGTALKKCRFVREIEPIETNIIIFYLNDHISEKDFISKLKDKKILLSTMGEGKLRMVTHLDISKEMIDEVVKVLENL